MRWIFLFLFLFFNFPVVHALNFQPSQEQYVTGDTLRLEIQVPGLVNALTADNFLLTLNETRVDVPVFFVRLSGEKYFIYLPLPQQEANYSFLVRNYDVIEDGILKQKTDAFSFSVVQGNGLGIDPAIIDARDNRDLFYIRLRNNANTTIAFNVTTPVSWIRIGPSSEYVELDPGHEKRLIFSLVKARIDQDSSYIAFLDYKIPVLVSYTPKEITVKEYSLRFVDSAINMTISVGDTPDGAIRFRNFGSEDISELNVSIPRALQNIILVSPLSFSSLAAGETKTMQVAVLAVTKPGIYQANITLFSKDVRAELPVYLEFLPKNVVQPKNTTVVDMINESNATIPLPPTPKQKSTAWIWFLVFFVILVIAVFVFFLIKKKEKMEEISDVLK